MNMPTLNPAGSDAVALAAVIAKRARLVLTTGAEYIAIAVLVLSAILMAAVIAAVNVDYEVVAVTPGGALMPLVQLDKDNEHAQRALLGEVPVQNAAPAAAPVAQQVGAQSPPARSPRPPQNPQQRKAASIKQ